MANWNKDRNRQLMKRARAEEIEAKIKEASSAGPARKSPPKLSKAQLRKTAEDLVEEYKEKLRQTQGDPGVSSKRGPRHRRR
jgi:hypothetical protein